MKTAIQALSEALLRRNAGALLVTKPKNIAYTTGFFGLSKEEREASLLITRDQVIFYLPAMYESKARRLPLVINGSIMLSINKERDYLLTSFRDQLNPGSLVLYEGHDLRVSELTNIQKTIPIFSFEDAGEMIEQLRLEKSPQEIELIRRAVSITDQTYLRLVEFLRHTDYTRLTELDVADEIITIARDLGGRGLGFYSIVASGANSAEPHYVTSTRRLQQGDLLLLDFGVRYGGYSGDLTRVIALGKPNEEVQRIYGIVLDNLHQSIEYLKPGLSAGELYDFSNNQFKKLGLDTYFLHGLGHGIGLEVHEAPLLRPGHNEIIKPNMTLTIEPGLYFEGSFGVRIEDFVLVTENGCQVLSTSQRELVII